MTGPDTGSPSGPTLEIERKYLLRGLPERVRGVAPLLVEQGYIPGTLIRERIRRTERGGATRWYRTFKSGTGLVREELEEETTAEIFEAMWPLTLGRRIFKRRYEVPEGSHLWEVDEFTDRELVLAEVELSRADEVVEIPDWLAPWLVREVTDDPAYRNSVLAR